MDAVHRLVLETIQLGKQALVFAPSRASAEKSAEEISKLTAVQLPELEQEILKAASTPTKQCRRLSHCIRKGIAFHHAGLLQKQKDLIEDGFRDGTIKIICCTPTLAAGMDLPAFRVIIKSLKRYSGSWGMDWIPVLEYLQMAGRAGRPGYESFGEAIVIAKSDSDKDQIYEKYILGEPEEIYSKLAVEPVLRTYLLSLISSGIIRDRKSMRDFFAKTFWAHQFKDLEKLDSIMESMLGLLREWNFVRADTSSVSSSVSSFDNSDNDGSSNSLGYSDSLGSSGFITANKLDRDSKENNGSEDDNFSGKRLLPTLIGKRISELYLDPLTAKHLLDCLNNYDAKKEKNVSSLLQMISHTLEMRPLLRVKSKEQDLIQEELIRRYDLLLEPEPSAFDLEYPEFINSIKTTLFFEYWIEEKDEDFLLEKLDIRPGEIRVKLEIADWLLYSCIELARINNLREAAKEMGKLRLRVKYGVKEELLNLLQLNGVGRVRARKLYLHGIKDFGDLKKIDLTALSQLLGKTLAENVKKEVGGEIIPVPKGTRKGQLSINKFTS